ncbi:MAG TPA: DMT family transporter, partial [Bryobacteraceae bacterium]|nr:DMT family transporter [Bryobacteraceae bacterium]
VAIGNVLGFAAALPMALPVGEVGIRDIGALLYLGLIQISLAYYLLTRAIQSVTAFEAATLMLLEPALNPLWAWLAVGERPAELTLIGGAVIIGVSLMHAWWQNRSVPAR